MECLSDASLIEEDEGSVDSSGTIELPGVPITAPPPPTDPRGELNFRGWPPEEIGPRNPSSPLGPEDAGRPFRPDFFKKVPNYKYLNSPEEISGFTTKTLVKNPSNSHLASAPTSSSKKKKNNVNVSITPSPASKREWRPSAQYFKPLQIGWVREVVLSLTLGDEPTIFYHSPNTTSRKSRTFRHVGELDAFLTHSNSGLTSHNFSFRKENMGAPPGQEIVRNENENVEIFPAKAVELKKVDHSKALLPEGPAPPLTTKLKIKNILKNNDESVQITPIKSKPGKEGSSRVINIDSDANNLSCLLSPMLKETLTKKNEVSLTPSTTVTRSSATSSKKSGGVCAASITPASSPFLNWPSSVSVSPASSSQRPTLRPKRTDHGACSIHCGGGASGFPSLSCSKCHSLFHPACVGLGEGNSYSGYDFICNECSPLEKENSNPKKPAVSFGPVQSSSRSSKAGNNGSTATPPMSTSVTMNRVHGPGYSQSSTGGTPAPKKLPLRPIETQSVINISGSKYLVVPVPPSNNSSASSKRSGASNVSSKGNSNHLPLLLKPVAGSDKLPTFEVEETSDGKLILMPVSTSGLEKVKKKKRELEEEDVPDTKRFCRYLTSNLTSAYYALIHVFKYLSTQERIQVSRVCRLWRDLVYHPSLWKTVSLKGSKVYNWRNFTEYLNRTKAFNLDLRKMAYVKGPEETWSDIFNVAPDFRYVTRIELPKVSGSILTTLVSRCRRIQSITASSIVKEINLEELVDGGSGLKEIKLKSNVGFLKLSSAARISPLLNLNLTSLSLLSVEDLSPSDFAVVASLRELTELSLGECMGAPNLFEQLSSLTKLRTLRLETVKIDGSIKLIGGSSLERLELVDSQLVQGFGSGFIKLRRLKQLLLIPVYKDEVAAINSEIIDFALSMPNLTHFFLGLTNEWLDSMNSILSMSSDKSVPVRDSFPILVNGVCEMYSLSKLFKTLSAALPMSKVKILKMSQQSTKKQHISTLMS